MRFAFFALMLSFVTSAFALAPLIQELRPALYVMERVK